MKEIKELSFNTAASLWKQKDELFKLNELDLQAVKINSAGIALLVQWAKATPNQKLKLKNVTQSALNLIRTYRLGCLFEIEK